MCFVRVKSFPKQNLTVLAKMRLYSSSEGNILTSCRVCCINILLNSYARSADALKELVRLIPNFQKKIDEAEPDDAQEFYSIVSTQDYIYDVARSFHTISCKMAQRMHVATMFLN